MKNIVFAALLLLTIFISCKKERIDEKNSQAIKVTAQKSFDDILKTVYFPDYTVKWLGGVDQIGLFSDRAYTSGPGVFASNIPYTAQSTNGTSNFISPTTIYFDGSLTPHNFYGYYPYVEGSFTRDQVPVSLPSVQAQVGTSTSHIGALDFEVAKPLALTPVGSGSNPTVDFVFNHIFSIIRFDLTCNTINSLTSISVTTSAAPAISLNTGSTIDISQSEPAAGDPYIFTVAPGGNPLNVTLYTNLTISTTPASAYMLILPGNDVGRNFTITFTAASGKTYTMNKAGIRFERGKVYTFTQDIPTGGANW